MSSIFYRTRSGINNLKEVEALIEKLGPKIDLTKSVRWFNPSLNDIASALIIETMLKGIVRIDFDVHPNQLSVAAERARNIMLSAGYVL